MTNLILVGDGLGIPQLLRHFDSRHVVAIVGASNRPQYHEVLQALADRHNVAFVVQPKWQTPAYDDFMATIAALDPDVFVVNSYSMILRDDLLAVSSWGGVNIHAALLPAYRGSNPVQWALINREPCVGITLHEVSSDLDQGAIIDQVAVDVLFQDSWRDLSGRLAEAADIMLRRQRHNLLNHTWHSVPQEEELASAFRRRTPDDGRFSWNDPLIDIYNLIRALVAPLPGAFVDEGGKRTQFDQMPNLAELMAQKISRCSVRYGGSEFRVEHVGAGPALLHLRLIGTDGEPSVATIERVDWASKSAVVSVPKADSSSLSALKMFCRAELGLAVVSLADGSVHSLVESAPEDPV